MKKKTIIKLAIILLIFLITILAIIKIMPENEILKNIYFTLSREDANDIENILSYKVYDNTDNNNLKTLVKVKNNNGIEYIENPDGNIIYGNGKKEVYIDYPTALNQDNIFKIKIGDRASFVEKNMKVTQEEINSYIKVLSVTKQDKDVRYSLDFENRSESDSIKLLLNSLPKKSFANINDVLLKYSDIDEIRYSDEKGYYGIVKISMTKVDQAQNVVYVEKELEYELDTAFLIKNDKLYYNDTETGIIEITPNNIIDKELLQIIASDVVAMKYLITNEELKNAIIGAENYSTQLAKVILDSTAIRENIKEQEGLPFYIFKTGDYNFYEFESATVESPQACNYEFTTNYLKLSSYDIAKESRGGKAQIVSEDSFDFSNYLKIGIQSNLTFLGGYNSRCFLTLPSGETKSFYNSHNTELIYDCMGGRGKLKFYLANDASYSWWDWYIYNIYVY